MGPYKKHFLGYICFLKMRFCFFYMGHYENEKALFGEASYKKHFLEKNHLNFGIRCNFFIEIY